MPVLFWALAAAMLAVALAMALLPLLRGHNRAQASRAQMNVAIHRQRLAELEAQRAEGALDDEDYRQARAEIERSLLDDVASDDSAADSTPKPGRTLPTAVALAIPALAVGLYLVWGNPGVLQQPATPDLAQMEDGSGGQARLEAIVAELERRVQSDPESFQDWFMLARAYTLAERLEDARRAYARAHALEPTHPDAMIGYAETLARLNDGDLRGRPAELIEHALQRAPQAPRALWLAGVAAFQSGDAARALERWEQLRALGGLGAEESALLDRFIARARTAAGEPSEGQAKGQVSLRVQVSLDPALAARVEPTDPVFVFARATEGPPMPIAVVRRQAGDLPLTVVLDDSQAMTPELKLSQFDIVVVGARVARSGNATPSSGDLQGITGALRPGETTSVRVSISEVVR